MERRQGSSWTWRWTGEAVQLVVVHPPPDALRVSGPHDPACATTATVLREDGTLVDVPLTTLTPLYRPEPEPRRFFRLPHPERTPAPAR